MSYDFLISISSLSEGRFILGTRSFPPNLSRCSSSTELAASLTLAVVGVYERIMRYSALQYSSAFLRMGRRLSSDSNPRGSPPVRSVFISSCQVQVTVVRDYCKRDIRQQIDDILRCRRRLSLPWEDLIRFDPLLFENTFHHHIAFKGDSL